MQRAVKKSDNGKTVKNPIDKEIHKRSTKIMEKIFENESNEDLIE